MTCRSTPDPLATGSRLPVRVTVTRTGRPARVPPRWSIQSRNPPEPSSEHEIAPQATAAGEAPGERCGTAISRQGRPLTQTLTRSPLPVIRPRPVTWTFSPGGQGAQATGPSGEVAHATHRAVTPAVTVSRHPPVMRLGRTPEDRGSGMPAHGAGTSPSGSRPSCRAAASTVWARSVAMVMGPTAPGLMWSPWMRRGRPRRAGKWRATDAPSRSPACRTCRSRGWLRPGRTARGGRRSRRTWRRPPPAWRSRSRRRS